jgi:hypothetical protein
MGAPAAPTSPSVRAQLTMLTCGAWAVCFFFYVHSGSSPPRAMALASICSGGALLACEAHHALSRRRHNFGIFLLAACTGSCYGLQSLGSPIFLAVLYASLLVTFSCVVGVLSRRRDE